MGENRPTTDRYIAFIAGMQVLESQERIESLGCCTTHDKAYRYALLGTGDFITERNENTLTDGTDIQQAGVVLDPDDLNHIALLKETITDTRQRVLFCNGGQISSDKRYDGLYCCGDYAVCVYVEDDYLSGWKDEWSEGTAYGANRKYAAHPGWGDSQPPSPSDYTDDGIKLWDYYKALYPGFAVDVFYEGALVGTYKLNDDNSPIYYDKLVGNWVWLVLSVYHAGVGYGIGRVPWSLEGTLKCGGGKLLIPYDGGITSVGGTEVERRVFP